MLKHVSVFNITSVEQLHVLNIAALRKAIGEKIPKYMLPTEYHREEVLKQNSSGKIDRAHYFQIINSHL